MSVQMSPFCCSRVCREKVGQVISLPLLMLPSKDAWFQQ